MSKFATFANGIATAFFAPEIHGARSLPVYSQPTDGSDPQVIGSAPNPDCTIPASAVEITDDQWAELLAYPETRRWDGSGIVPYTPPARTVEPSEVDAERNRRIAAGFEFAGDLYQAREQDLRNINGAATGAALALMQGATAGDLRWQGGDSDFGWISADNTIVPMDVLTMIGFGRAAMAHVERLTMLGRSIKDRLADGETIDITDDALWGE